MELLTYQEATLETALAYRKKHKGWEGLQSVSKNKFLNEVIVSPDGVWLLKSDRLYKNDLNPLGVGVRIDFDTEKLLDGSGTFGFKPNLYGLFAKLNEQKFMFEAYLSAGMLKKAQQARRRLMEIRDELDRIAKQQYPLESLNGPIIMQGRFRHYSPQQIFGKSQNNLEERLENEMKKLRSYKYPQYG